MDVDELSDLDGGECVHPPGCRDYDGGMSDWGDGVEVMEWSIACSECGMVLAQGADRL